MKLRMQVFRDVMYSFYSYMAANAGRLTGTRIGALEMYPYRCVLQIVWARRKTNEIKRRLLKIIKEMKLFYFGHTIRGSKYEILRLIIEGKIAGNKPTGRYQNL